MENHQSVREQLMLGVLGDPEDQLILDENKRGLALMLNAFMEETGVDTNQLKLITCEVFRSETLDAIHNPEFATNHSHFQTTYYDPILAQCQDYVEIGATEMLLPEHLNGRLLMDIINQLEQDGFNIKVEENDFGMIETSVLLDDEYFATLINRRLNK